VNIKYEKMHEINDIKFKECGGIPCTHLVILYMHMSAPSYALKIVLLQSSELDTLQFSELAQVSYPEDHNFELL
jgi:hypothetical protein